MELKNELFINQGGSEMVVRQKLISVMKNLKYEVSLVECTGKIKTNTNIDRPDSVLFTSQYKVQIFNSSLSDQLSLVAGAKCQQITSAQVYTNFKLPVSFQKC